MIEVILSQGYLKNISNKIVGLKSYNPHNSIHSHLLQKPMKKLFLCFSIYIRDLYGILYFNIVLAIGIYMRDRY